MPHTEKLASVLREIASRWEIPGLAVGLFQDGEPVHTEALGVQNIDTQEPVDLDTSFCMASVSKPFAATATMQLAERGELRLDAPVIDYLPYFSLRDPRSTQITVRQLLSHTSGMPDMAEHEYTQLWANPEYDEGASERLVRSLNRRAMVHEPGEAFHYSNLGLHNWLRRYAIPGGTWHWNHFTN